MQQQHIEESKWYKKKNKKKRKTRRHSKNGQSGAIIWVVVNFGNKKFFTGLYVYNVCFWNAYKICTQCGLWWRDDHAVANSKKYFKFKIYSLLLNIITRTFHFMKCVMLNIMKIFWFALLSVAPSLCFFSYFLSLFFCWYNVVVHTHRAETAAAASKREHLQVWQQAISHSFLSVVKRSQCKVREKRAIFACMMNFRIQSAL